MAVIDSEARVLTMPDLSVKLGRLELRTPIITASGTSGYADEFEEFTDMQAIGAIVTKGITLEPRKGNPQPRIKELKNAIINSIGLENVGIRAFIDTKLPVLNKKNIPFIMNIAGFTLEEYFELAKICEINGIQAIELNVSCPNVKSGCLEFGTNEEVLYNLVSRIRDIYSGTMIVKLTPNVTDPKPLAQAIERGGADIISAINTVRALNVEVKMVEGRLVKSTLKGGMSGPAIKPIALNFINTISSAVKIPIIGMGGIMTFTDMLEFLSVGSTAIQVGTASFVYPDITERLVTDLEYFLSTNNISGYSKLIRGE